MDIAFLLILPLLGGYIFASNWDGCRHSAAREDGHRLYFRAAFFAALLFLLAVGAHAWLLSFTWYEGLEQTIASTKLEPLIKLLRKSQDSQPAVSQFPLFVISVEALLLGLVLWGPLNLLMHVIWKMLIWLTPRDPSLSKVMQQISPFYLKAIKDNELENLLVAAAVRPMPIALTLETGKVYVGFVLNTAKPSVARKTITILPLASGYRDSDGRISFTTYYAQVYQKMEGQEASLGRLTPEDFRKIIPVERMVTVSMFDLAVYEQFQQPSRQTAMHEQLELKY